MKISKILAVVVALGLAPPAAAQTGLTINGLGAGSAVGGTNIFPAYQGANPATGVTAAQMAAYVYGLMSGACTASGTGTVTCGGVVTSVTAGCGLTISPTTGAVVASASVTARNNTTTSDTLLGTDCGSTVTENNASAVAVGIAQAGTTGFLAGTYWTLKNKGAGLVTLTPTTSTIDGNASLTLKQNQSVDFYSDGTNYITLPGRPTNVACADLTNAGAGCTAATMTATAGGLVPTPPNNTTTFLRGDGTFATPAGGGGGGLSGILPYVSGGYYLPYPPAGATTANGLNNTVSYCRLWYFKGQATVDTLGASVGTSSAGTNFQMAIYALNAGTQLATGLPLAKTASISSAATAGIVGAVNSGTPIQLGSSTNAYTPYWFCIMADTTSAANFVDINGGTGIATDVASTSAATALFQSGNGFGAVQYTGQTYGTWADLTSATANRQGNGIAAIPIFHLSSVP